MIHRDRIFLREMECCDLNFKATELRLGLPGSDAVSPAKKRSSPESDDAAGVSSDRESAPPPPK